MITIMAFTTNVKIGQINHIFVQKIERHIFTNIIQNLMEFGSLIIENKMAQLINTMVDISYPNTILILMMYLLYIQVIHSNIIQIMDKYAIIWEDKNALALVLIQMKFLFLSMEIIAKHIIITIMIVMIHIINIILYVNIQKNLQKVVASLKMIV